jgi:hypothetical protein
MSMKTLNATALLLTFSAAPAFAGNTGGFFKLADGRQGRITMTANNSMATLKVQFRKGVQLGINPKIELRMSTRYLPTAEARGLNAEAPVQVGLKHSVATFDIPLAELKNAATYHPYAGSSHVAEDHKRQVPASVLSAGEGIVDPDLRVLAMLGARGSHVAASTKGERKSA